MKSPDYSCVKTTYTARGTSLTEVTFVMAILGAAFIGIFSVMSFIGTGMNAERTRADQFTRTSGTLYDIVSELREATVYSPNFYIEQNPLMPPRITFDKIDTVDANGNTVWGNKITYRLDRATDAPSNNTGIIQGRIIREEVSTKSGVGSSTSYVEENAPYQYIQKGVATWGFNVTLDGCALSLTLSRFGDVSVQVGDDSKLDAIDADTPLNTGMTSASSQGTSKVLVLKGTYYLRNPQEVIPAQ